MAGHTPWREILHKGLPSYGTYWLSRDGLHYQEGDMTAMAPMNTRTRTPKPPKPTIKGLQEQLEARNNAVEYWQNRYYAADKQIAELTDKLNVKVETDLTRERRQCLQSLASLGEAFAKAACYLTREGRD